MKKITAKVMVTSLMVAFFVLVPSVKTFAASARTWVGATNTVIVNGQPVIVTGSLATASNWSPNGALSDGDSLIFDSRKWDLSTWGSATTPTLANPNNPTLAGVSVVGGSGAGLGFYYSVNVDQLKVSDGAVISSADGNKYSLTIGDLTALGDVAIDGVSALNIDASQGGNVTIKNRILSSVSNYTLASGKSLILGAGTTLSLSGDTDSDYTVQVDTGATLNLGSAAFTKLNVVMNGGELRITGGTPTSITSVTLLADSTFSVSTDGNTLTIGTLTTNGHTLAAEDQNQLIVQNTVSGTIAAPDTAVKLLLSNPVASMITTVVLIASVFGIMKLKKTQ